MSAINGAEQPLHPLYTPALYLKEGAMACRLLELTSPGPLRSGIIKREREERKHRGATYQRFLSPTALKRICEHPSMTSLPRLE